MSVEQPSVATDASAPSTPPLRRTPLHPLQLKLGARMVPFAGYEMPVQFAAGVLKEHLHVRASAGLFDVSHMGQLIVRAKSGAVADAARALERLVPVDILGLAAGRQRYALFTNPTGGVLDDLMVTNCGDHFLLVVNGACKEADEAHLRALLYETCDIERLDRALIALQGPKAEAALAALVPGCADMTFMDVREMVVLGHSCIVARAGYTGEDGFEISMPAHAACEIADALLSNPLVAPIGLGARDSLRLEAGLCLYGCDLDEKTTPVDASLGWAISKARRAGGSRAGGFPGADVILSQLSVGSARCRVGLRPEGRGPVRGGASLFSSQEGGAQIGIVTSGGFGPSVDAPVAMGSVASEFARVGLHLFAEVRGKRLPVAVAPLPFVAPHYKRG
jgi:aminomethyltransferase